MGREGQARQTLRWVCFAVLLTAVVFRLPWRRLFEPRQEALPAAASAPSTYPTLYYSPPSEPTAPPPPGELEFTQVAVRSPAGTELDMEALMAQPLNFDLQQEGPVILIVHTHATEAYTPDDGETYLAEGSFRTLDTAYNVVRVGRELAQRLNRNGIPTLHDTTLNDVPGYNDAYERMAEVIAGYLELYPSIQMVIDVHRDSVAGEDGRELALRAELEGQPAAQLLFVMGTDLAGLLHPNWRGNLGFALQLQAYCQRRAPGLFRDLTLRTQRYNEHLTPHSVLLEVGTAGNTLTEACRSAVFFADRLTELLTAP